MSRPVRVGDAPLLVVRHRGDRRRRPQWRLVLVVDHWGRPRSRSGPIGGRGRYWPYVTLQYRLGHAGRLARAPQARAARSQTGVGGI